MIQNQSQAHTDTEELIAELARTAYEVALRHGVQGSFLDLELELWQRMRSVVEDQQEAVS
jgi:hypothetical protein